VGDKPRRYSSQLEAYRVDSDEFTLQGFTRGGMEREGEREEESRYEALVSDGSRGGQ